MTVDPKRIELYERTSGKKVPPFRPMPAERRGELLQGLGRALAVSADASAVLTALQKRARVVSDVSAEAEDFDLGALFAKLALTSPQTVIVNWRRFDDLDEFVFDDFAKNFDKLWFAGADDIELIDPNLAWVLLVRHDGRPAVLALSAATGSTR